MQVKALNYWSFFVTGPYVASHARSRLAHKSNNVVVLVVYSGETALPP